MRNEHTLWLDAYYDTVAQTLPYNPKLPLIASQIDAYRALPDLIDQCQKTWLDLPESSRPTHYLSYV